MAMAKFDLSLQEDGVETSGMLGASPENVGRIIRIGDNKKRGKIKMEIPRGPAKVEHYKRYFEESDNEDHAGEYESNMQNANDFSYERFINVCPKYRKLKLYYTREEAMSNNSPECIDAVRVHIKGKDGDGLSGEISKSKDSYGYCCVYKDNTGIGNDVTYISDVYKDYKSAVESISRIGVKPRAIVEVINPKV